MFCGGGRSRDGVCANCALAFHLCLAYGEVRPVRGIVLVGSGHLGISYKHEREQSLHQTCSDVPTMCTIRIFVLVQAFQCLNSSRVV